MDLLTFSQVGSISSHLIFSLCFKHIAMREKSLKKKTKRTELQNKGNISFGPKMYRNKRIGEGGCSSKLSELCFGSRPPGVQLLWHIGPESALPKRRD